MPLRALVFDFDGLIVDTESVIIEAWRAEYARHGAEFDLESFVRTNVGTIRGQAGYVDEYDELERLIGRPVDRAEIEARRVEHHERLLAGIEPNPGVVDWVAAARDVGLALAVASSSSAGWVAGLLPRLGFDGAFDAVVTRTDVGDRAKPDPAVYLEALRRLGAEPDRAAALEDSPHGAEAAHRAGMFAVAVPSHITRSLDFAHAHHVVPSLAEFTLDELFTLAERRVQERPGPE